MFLYGASFYLCQCLLVQVIFQMWGTGLLLPAVWGESHKIAVLSASCSLSSLSPFSFPTLCSSLTNFHPSPSLVPVNIPLQAVCSPKTLFSPHPRVLSPTAWRWWPHHSAVSIIKLSRSSPLCVPPQWLSPRADSDSPSLWIHLSLAASVCFNQLIRHFGSQLQQFGSEKLHTNSFRI